jgi:hypothetical protein
VNIKRFIDSPRVQKGSLITLGILFFAGAITAVTIALWPESAATAKKNFCNSLTNLSSTVMSYQGLDPRTATNDELDSAYDDIASAYDAVVDDANDWANAYDNPLNEAYDDLYWAVQDLPGDNTVAQDINDLQPELSAFPSAFHETFDGSGCTAV